MAMDEILGTIYCLFESLFGQYLAEYLWGYDCNTETYNRILFNSIGLIAIVVSLSWVVLYYYVINHPRFNKWWHWVIMLIILGGINLFIAYGWTVSDFTNGLIGDCLMYTRNEEGEIISQLIYESDCWMFGVVNFIVSVVFFILFSFLFKWWSTNCKHSPCL
jgi:hypothetical protein